MTQTMLPIVILAGGEAIRLRPVTEKIPKALVEINDVPFISHQLDLLKRNNISDIVICAGYLGNMLRDYLGNGSKFGVNIKYSFDGDVLLGTGGAIKKAINLLGDSFFVIYGDSYLPCDFKAVQKAYFKQKKQALMTVYHNKEVWDKSNIEYDSGKILVYDKINRSGKMKYIDYGLGLFSSRAFDFVESNENVDLALIYQKLLREDKLAAYEVHERVYEVGSFRGIEDFSGYLKNKQNS